MKGTKAVGTALVACILVGGALALAGAGRSTVLNGDCQLAAQIPAAVRKGHVTTLILQVRQNGRPVDHAAACLATAPLFVSLEDVLDTTPAGGVDLGSGPDSAVRPACTNAIAGTQSGDGRYAFEWEPDTAGRVNLIFSAAGSTLIVPVDVGSEPPSAIILILFATFVAAVLITAGCLRRRLRPGGAAS